MNRYFQNICQKSSFYVYNSFNIIPKIICRKRMTKKMRIFDKNFAKLQEQIYKAALKYNANEKEKDKIYAELN